MAENTIIHEISLAGYKATSTGGMLDLGTWGSYGIEKLHLTLDAAWQDLTITAFFNVKGEVVGKALVGKDGYADVPWEATKENTFAGRIVFEGSMNNQRRISANLNFKVTNHSEFEDSDPVPTDDRWNQFVTQNKEYRDGAYEAAERANARAEDAEVASEGAQAAARAAKASESAADTLAAKAERAAQEAENSNTAANNAAYLAGENATAAQQAAENAAAAANYAGQSASDAAASKAAAETAAQAAQEAQAAAAAARDDAVKAHTAAQTAAKTAQDAQNAAEKARDDAQTAQQGAEAARDAAAGSAEAAAKSEENAKQSANTLAESVENVVANTAAVAELKQQVANITPDDSTIGDKPWSSKHIIDMLFPPLEESGNPVVCYPVAGYPLGVKASWEPMQEGTGTPSQENIRPIKGRDSVRVERCGENLLNPKENAYNTYTPYGLTITYIGDNKVHLSGTYNREVGGGSFGILDTKQKLLAGRNLKITGFTIEGTKQTYTLYGLRAKDETVIAMNAQFAKGDVIDMTVAIVVSKDTPTTYKPYIGQTTPLTLPETVYGGEVDAVSGEGQETWKSVSLDGTENWNTWGVNKNNATVTGFYTYDINDYSNDIGDRDKILCSTVLRTTENIWGGKNVGIGFADSGTSKYLIYCMKTDTLSDTTNDKEAITSFKTFLADLYTAGTPVQVAYVLNEPVPFTATGAQPLIALAGANTVLTDADSATVTGRADPIKRITDLEAAVASIN